MGKITLSGIVFSGSEFRISLHDEDDGFVSANPAYTVRNEFDVHLCSVKNTPTSIHDAAVVKAPDDRELFRWRVHGEVTRFSAKYFLVESETENRLAILQKTSVWDMRNWWLTAPAYDEIAVIRRHVPRLTRLSVLDRDGDEKLASVKQSLFQGRFRVTDHGMPGILKALVVLSLPVIEIKNAGS